MKDFLKYTLATICGIVILSIISGILFVITLAGMMASESASTKASKNSVFVLKLNGTVDERSEDGGPLSSLLGQAGMEAMGLDDIVKAIGKAKAEDNIKGIYIEGGAVAFDSPATAQQVRDALADFKESGKWIIAYGDQFMQMGYYVASVADSVFLNKTGMIDFKGMGHRSEYMKGLYDKLGVRYQAARVGKYKSYVERQTRTGMSDEDREQRTAYLQGIWRHMLDDISRSRGMKAEALNQLADDSIMVFADAADYMSACLVDGLLYPEEMKALVKEKLGIDADKDINQMSLSQVLSLPDKTKKRGDEVAVYYAYGEIVDAPLSGFMGGHAIVGKETADDLNRLAADDDVKAVVLRVNSGGGSAVASEQIWHAVKLLKEKKPVVVSMGGAAASGGYMISAAANHIVAEPTTITGSIGIFGLIPNLSGLVTDKLGVTFDGVVTNRFTDYEEKLVFTADNSDEMRFLQGYTDRGYESFLGIVADGRGMTKEQVDEIAQGRVWLATDAQGIGLVDQIGSLADAVAKAAELAEMGDDYHTATYPAQKGWFEQLMGGNNDNDNYLDAQLRAMLGDLYQPIVEMRLDQQRNRLQARLPFSLRVE